MAFKGRAPVEFDPSVLQASLNGSKSKKEDYELWSVVQSLVNGSIKFRDTLANKFASDGTLLANKLSGKVPIKNGGTLSGQYVPFVSNLVNCGVGVDLLYFYQSGFIVTVTGRFAVTPTAIGINTEFAFLLPIISYFKFYYECAGAAYSPTENQGAAILADVGNNRAKMQFISVNNVQIDLFFTFAYKIIEKTT